MSTNPLFKFIKHSNTDATDNVKKFPCHIFHFNGIMIVFLIFFFFKKKGPFSASFSFISSFLQTVNNNCSIKVADDWIRTRVFWLAQMHDDLWVVLTISIFTYKLLWLLFGQHFGLIYISASGHTVGHNKRLATIIYLCICTSSTFRLKFTYHVAVKRSKNMFATLVQH